MMSKGRRPVGIPSPFDHSDRFPDAFKTRQRKCREASFEFVIHTGAVRFPRGGCEIHGVVFRPVLDGGEDDETGAMRLR